MYKAFRKAGVSLVAIAALVLLFAPSAMARDWARHRGDRGDIVGMDVRARQGGIVGKVNDVVLAPEGRGWEVIIGLNGSGEVTVPRSSISVDRGYVVFQGTRDELYSMASAYPHHGYYGDRYNDRGRRLR